MIDRLIDLSIRQRWLVLALTLLAAGVGLHGYLSLPIDAVPDITNVQVQISTKAPGYSPLEVESRITFPVERAMAGLPKLKNSRSISRYGLSQVTVVFRDGTDIYWARQLVAQRIQSARSDLPPGIEPEMGPVATGLGEIFMYAVEAKPGAVRDDGQPYTPTDLRTIQDWIIRPQLQQVPGVTEADTIGGYVKEIHVLPDPAKLLAYRLSLDDVARALEANNVNVGAGYIEHNGEQSLIRVPGQVTSLDDVRRVVLAVRGRVPITVGEVAEVAIGKPLRTGAATFGGHETVLGTTFMLIGENSRVVSRAVAAKLEQVRKALPEGIQAITLYDRTVLVDKTIATVQKNLFEGAVLVIVVLFAFLGNLRAALLTAMVIPLSLLFTFAGMVRGGISGNLMSLGALDFGLIVDGSVIIVENCILRLAQAQHHAGRLLNRSERFRAVFEATREVFRPSLISVLVVVLVNLPIFALEGVEGKMFHPMAATVILALLGALVFSVTFVPAACALLLSGRIAEKDNFLVSGAKRIYRPALDFALRRRLPVLAAALLLVIGCGWLATRMGAEFIPQLDEGDVIIFAGRITGIGIEQAVEMQKPVNEALAKLPEVQTVFSRTGTNEAATDPMSPSETDTFVILKETRDWPDPDKSKTRLLADMQTALDKIPGNAYGFSQPIQMRFNELISGVRADVAVKIFGDDLDELLKLGHQVGAVLGRVPGGADIKVEQADGLPTLTVQPNRIALARYGLDMAAVQDTVATALGGKTAGLFFEGDRRFGIVVRLPERLRADTRTLERLPIPLPGDRDALDGGYVPLSEVATIRSTIGPNQISRDNGKRRIVVQANVRGRDLGSFIEEVRTRIEREVKLPAGYFVEYGGTFEQLASAASRLQTVVPLALLLIFGLLVMNFGSVKDAALVYSGVPLALTGGVLALWLRDIPLSISAGVGFITLSGVAVLTGVVMVSAFRDLREQGTVLEDAVIQGAMLRLRPIIMIALVASLGFLPMALNTGTGAEVQRPLATVVIGGIISATLLSLLVLPGLYRIAYRPEENGVSDGSAAAPGANG